ncbi:PREDICTED: WD and tetratricopeptide repeats protein 1 [Camelina sativa]|uniref:WD and tetratricopeptide repeats protein 1 n=1 Tax=Camelina sativa TaxID=90675 RepID=A0ABM0V9X5_CAMSA|nr:PREDICTED: WD and tetratricopeptide repeats protein 1 [Camelina sativa]
MENLRFHDGNIFNLLHTRSQDPGHEVDQRMQLHSSLVRRLSQEEEMEGHQGCVNALAWNSNGSLLISGSDDLRINIWNYSSRKLLHSIDTGHTANIFCTKFVPETSDELVVSGAGDAEVRLFDLSRLSSRGDDDNAITPSALYQCHTRRVKKLAVEPGNPNVVWSASEDGTLRQHDFRESTSCPPAGSAHQECRSVLLDLRSGAKRALADPPKQTLSLKSCDISATRPHLLLVGGSDAFARLYDRRMLPPLTSSRKRMPPPPCVNYFCPIHLSERGRTNLHLTHVTFSPNGEEVLLSYSGEHAYLMNVNNGTGIMQYTPGDVDNFFSFSNALHNVESPPQVSVTPQSGSHRNNNFATVKKCTELVEIAKMSLEEGTDVFYAIEAANEVLDAHSNDIESALRLECLCTRAALLLKRKWKNDAHMAVRDCQNARRIDASSFKAHYYMSEALHQLGRCKEALDFAIAAQHLNPSDADIVAKVESIKRDLQAAGTEKNEETGAGTTRVLSLSDILYRSEANSDSSHDMSRSEREDSDYDEELELDIQTSLSDDEGRDPDSNSMRGSLNLRIHRVGDDKPMENTVDNASSGTASSSQNDRTSYQPEGAIDMKRRYVGHCNTGTDIKQASFLGQRGEYIASGSDDGRWFIWEKQTGRLMKVLLGDQAVVNCIQCHPFDSVVATSGIDNTIKIWSPTAAVPSIVAGGSAGPATANVVEVMEINQQKLSHNRENPLSVELLQRFRMQELAEGNFHPFECTQS